MNPTRIKTIYSIRPRSAGLSLLALLPLLYFSFFARLTEIPVRIWDEARNANNALEMYLHGRWLIPYYEGAPDMWNTKPPLLIWLQAAGMHLFGTGELALRLPSALAAALTAILLWHWLTVRLNRPWAGFLAGAVLATTYAYVDNHAARTGDYDALLVLFTTFAALCCFNWLEDGRRKWLWLFFTALALAVLTKSVAGLTLLPGICLFALARRGFRILRQPSFYGGLLLFLVLVGGYYLLRERYNPGYLHAVYENELGGRYLQTLEGHKYPFLFYFDNLRIWRFAWWTPFAAVAFIAGFLDKKLLVKRITLFNLLMVFPFLLIVSLGGTKLDWYELPLYPFLALQTGLLLHTAWNRLSARLPANTNLRISIAVILFALVFFVPFRGNMRRVYHFKEKAWDEGPERQAYFLQDALRRGNRLDDYTFCYSDYNGQLYYYVNRLQAQGSGVRLFADTDGLPAGRTVVVSEPALEQSLLQRYPVKKLGEKFGCTVYLVRSSP